MGNEIALAKTDKEPSEMDLELKKLPKRVKAKWVKALRSGKYQQGRLDLKAVDHLGNTRYCCIGVLCELLNPESLHKGKMNHNAGLPGPSTFKPEVESVLRQSISKGDSKHHLMGYLANVNDGRREMARSFAEIADWIQENL